MKYTKKQEKKIAKSMAKNQKEITVIESFGIPADHETEGTYISVAVNKKLKFRVKLSWIFKPTPRSKMRIKTEMFKTLNDAMTVIDKVELNKDEPVFEGAIKGIKMEKTEPTKKKKEKKSKKSSNAPAYDKSLIETLSVKGYGEIRIIDYSPAAFAFFGEKTKELAQNNSFKGRKGFRYNPALTEVDGTKTPGWVVSKKAEKEMYAALTV